MMGKSRGQPRIPQRAIEAETSAHDAGQADVKETNNVVETPQDVGKEEEQPELQAERKEPR
jgi:hypothetical protein